MAPGQDWKSRLLFSEHHLSHAASAFYPSPFERAAVLTMDGVGEWTTTSLAIGNGRELEVVKEIHFPHSIGLLYSAFTYFTGFKVNSGEYKVMGLAPYGEPKYAQKIYDHVLDLIGALVFDDGAVLLAFPDGDGGTVQLPDIGEFEDFSAFAEADDVVAVAAEIQAGLPEKVPAFHEVEVQDSLDAFVF